MGTGRACTAAVRRSASFARRILLASLALALCGTLAACGGGDKVSLPLAGSSTKATGASFSLPSKVVVPQVADSGGSTTIDTTSLASGWVGVRATSASRLKFQVACGETTYSYDLPADGTPVCFPLNMGSGSYGFRIMENIEGSTYAEIDSAHADVVLESEFAPYLVPNVYCDYTDQSTCVSTAFELMSGVDNQGEAVREICNYVADNISYDYDKAQQLAQSTGYVPDVDATLASGTGICLDYASLTAAMMRSVGLPAQVVTGYVSPDNLYHAWTMVYVDGSWQTAEFSISPNDWSRCDVTLAAAGSGSPLEDVTGYTDQYTY